MTLIESKDFTEFASGTKVEIVLRGTVDGGWVALPDSALSKQWVIDNAHEVRTMPKPDFDEGDLVVDDSHYIFQKAPVGAEDEAGLKATENDGFWLVSDPEGYGPATPGSLWMLTNMSFPVTRIPKERLL